MFLFESLASNFEVNFQFRLMYIFLWKVSMSKKSSHFFIFLMSIIKNSRAIKTFVTQATTYGATVYYEATMKPLFTRNNKIDS